LILIPVGPTAGPIGGPPEALGEKL
jgi:hypothetical protein